MHKPTESQMEILRHSLGLAGDGTGTPYRNHYVPSDDDIGDCDALVEKGLMTRHDGSALSGGAPIFVVTLEGKGVARG